MRGLDVVGAGEEGLVDAGANAAKALMQYFKKPPETQAAPPASTAPSQVPQQAQLPAASHAAEKPEESGFFSKKLVGPVRVWHSLLGAGTLAGSLWFWKTRK